MEKCKIVHPESGELLDDGLAVFFKGEIEIFLFRPYLSLML